MTLEQAFVYLWTSPEVYEVAKIVIGGFAALCAIGFVVLITEK